MFRRLFQKTVNDLRQKPGSHLTAFLFIHEITAIAPIPLIYYWLDRFDVDYPIREDLMEEGTKRMTRILQVLGIQRELESKQLLHLVASYCIVKGLMPVRIGVSLALTPAGARLIGRIPKFSIKK